MKNLVSSLFNKYNIPFTDDMLEKFEKYYNLVLEWNQKINLTAITEKNDFAIKHFLDCCLPYCLLPQNASCLDVGAGAGFPSIPLKIIRPDLNIVMLDSLNKRINFLNLVISELNLKNITAIHSRIEDFGKDNRENFDVVVSRAVASLTTLSEYCLPYVKVGGKFVALKGLNFEQEQKDANFAIELLGGKIKNIQKVYIEEIDSTRANFEIEKVKVTPKAYPRGKNLPRVSPIVAK